MTSQIRTVTLIGADGKLGPSVLRALVDADFSVTVLKRSSSQSKSSYPTGVREVRISDDFPAEELLAVLQGQDALVATVPGSQFELQQKLADAAAKAGVRRFIPADFGSVDSQSERAREYVPLYVEKARFRNHLQELADAKSEFSWTSLVCGHFFDWDPKFLHIDVAERRADILDDGHVRASASTLSQIAKATAAVLLRAGDDATKNRILYIQSFCLTQIEVVRAFEKATGTEWAVTRFEGGKFLQEHRDMMAQGDRAAIEEVVWWLGAVEADWEGKSDFANELLGLQDEDIDEVVQRIVKSN